MTMTWRGGCGSRRRDADVGASTSSARRTSLAADFVQQGFGLDAVAGAEAVGEGLLQGFQRVPGIA